MEIITTVRDFPEKIKVHDISPDTFIRVIINKAGKKDGSGKILLQIITHEEQKRMLDLIPKEYEPGASEELVKIIGESHVNTDTPDL